PSGGPPPSAGPPAGAPTGGPPPSAGPPPAGAPATAGKSRRPLFIAIGVLVVVVLIAAFLLTRGGDDKKNVSANSSTDTSLRPTGSSNSTSDTNASSSGSAASSDVSPPGFITVNHTFDRGEVEVFVPEDWTDTFPVQLNNGEPRLRVAPKVSSFIDGTFTRPGVQIDAFSVDTNGINDPNNLDALLENFAHQPAANEGWPGGPPADVCTSAGRFNYPADLNTTSDGGFTGRFERFDGCRGAGALVVVFATPADQGFLVQMVMQIATPADEQALATILGSVLVVNFP
ncbi:MAG: serine protease Do, partial [Acidimicrobiaceae bacterium]|nr:serine protease Do [Acidimicrobiaceae bacterium]